MKQLTGRLLDIANGNSELPQSTALEYREKWKAEGFQLPEFSIRKSTKKKRRISPSRNIKRQRKAATIARDPLNPKPFTASVTRNLACHIYPVKKRWEWLVDFLLENEEKFNGTRLVYVMTGGRNLSTPAQVQKRLGSFAKVVALKNDKNLGEFVSFPRMVSALSTSDENQITLYCHAKGAKHKEPNTPAIRAWSMAMLEPLMALNQVESEFAIGADCVGAFGCDVFNMGKDVPAGSFYWYRNASYPSSVSPSHPPRMTTERWPADSGANTAYLMSHNGDLSGSRPFKELYKKSFWDSKGMEMLNRWRKAYVPPIEKPKVTLITPTGDRPEAFELCQKWLNQQTSNLDIQWIVVDDGATPMRPNGATYIRREPSKGHTLTANLREAVTKATGDFILIWEDDEYYPPQYIDMMSQALQSSELVGERGARYYMLKSATFKKWGEHIHSSLCRTGFRRSVLPAFRKAISTEDPSVDIRLWESWNGTRMQWSSNSIGAIGIKGMPGRSSHYPAHRKESPDTNLLTLKRWIPGDWKSYIPFIPEQEEYPLRVYTVNLGGYDSVAPISHPGATLITDSRPSAGWAIQTVDGGNSKLQSRRYKILSHENFNDEWTLYIDGNITLKGDVSEWFNSVLSMGSSDLYVYNHPDRDCIFEEADAIVRYGRDTEKNIKSLRDRYIGQRIPAHGGLYLGGILLRRNTKKTEEFNRLWWDEVESSTTHRDQLSLPVAIHRSGISFTAIPYEHWDEHFNLLKHSTTKTAGVARRENKRTRKKKTNSHINAVMSKKKKAPRRDKGKLARRRKATVKALEMRKANSLDVPERKKTVKARRTKNRPYVRGKSKMKAVPGKNLRKVHVQEVVRKIRVPSRWAVGFTIANRSTPTWRRAVQSCVDAGWKKPYLFTEPNVPKGRGATHGVWVQRPRVIAKQQFPNGLLGGRDRLFGPFQNYIQCLHDLLEAEPNADMILYLQDDAFIPPGTREWIESIKWPSQTGMLSLWCPSGHDYDVSTASDKIGLCESPKPRMIGAIGYAFKREAAEFLLKSDAINKWKGPTRNQNGYHRRALDMVTGEALHRTEHAPLYVTKTVIDHYSPTLNNSSIGNGSNIGFRKSYRYVGDKATSEDIMKEFNAKEIHVVIPTYDCEELITSCLDALEKSTVPLHICVVDNGSTHETRKVINERLFRSIHQTTILENGENLGFTHAIQQGLDLSDGRHTLLLNNDCRVDPDTIEEMLGCLVENEKVASVCPITDDNGNCSTRQARNRKLQEGGDIDSRGILPWFCCLLHRDAIAEMPTLPDHDALKAGLGVDDWWCKKATASGWKHYVTGRAFATHDHQSTFKQKNLNRYALQQAAIRHLSEMKE